MTKDEISRELAVSRDLLHAQLITINMGLAAERFPEELRKALGKVFDLSAVDQMTRRMMLTLADLGKAVAERQEQLGMLDLRVKAIEERIEALDFELDNRMRGTP